MADDYINFDEALKRLELQDAQLKRLISENEIKAYRDGDRMKLKKDDVDRLLSRLSGGGQTEELVFEDDEATTEPGMATVPLSEQETMMEKTARKPAAKPAAKSAATPRRPAAEKAAAPAPARRKKEAPVEVGGEETWVKALLIVSIILLFVAMFPAMDAVRGRAGGVSSGLPGVLEKK